MKSPSPRSGAAADISSTSISKQRQSSRHNSDNNTSALSTEMQSMIQTVKKVRDVDKCYSFTLIVKASGADAKLIDDIAQQLQLQFKTILLAKERELSTEKYKV
jgi:hypothetical protein